MSKIIFDNSMRTDIERYFELSGIREEKRLKHTPFIVFVEAENVKLNIVDNIADLLRDYSDETKVVAQWAGQWSSDFFKFTVGDLRKFISKNPKEDYQLA